MVADAMPPTFAMPVNMSRSCPTSIDAQRLIHTERQFSSYVIILFLYDRFFLPATYYAFRFDYLRQAFMFWFQMPFFINHYLLLDAIQAAPGHIIRRDYRQHATCLTMPAHVDGTLMIRYRLYAADAADYA